MKSLFELDQLIDSFYYSHTVLIHFKVSPNPLTTYLPFGIKIVAAKFMMIY
jgi:hypothetical protein